MSNLHPKPIVAAAQYPITIQADFAAWQRHTSAWVARGVATGARLLVFPEYGSIELLSSFPVEIQQDLQQNLSAMQPLVDDCCATWATLARQHDCVLVAPSLPILLGDSYINRAFVFSPKGLVGYQDKFFMTRFEAEDWGIVPAPFELTLFETDYCNFGIQICYDVEFPLGAQRLCAAGANLIVVPSCTETIRGATRVHVGARARALENQCFVVVAQTVGAAPWSPIVDINYGYGACYCPPDAGLPEEGIVAQSAPQSETWLSAQFDFERIANVRRDGQVLNFRDLGRMEMGYVGADVKVKTVVV